MGKQLSRTQQALELVERFKSLYNQLNAHNCHDGLIEAVYAEDMLFQDPFHSIQGRTKFVDHCASLYENVVSCSFDFHEQWVCDDDAMLIWTMKLVHPRINKGKEITVDGSSLIRFDNKVAYHRDYFDGAQLLYEHLPLMGSVIRQIKRRMV